MNRFEEILDECLGRMATEGYSVEQCLAQHPQSEAELRPLLEAAARVKGAIIPGPSHAYKGAAKGKLMARLEAKPRRKLGMLLPARLASLAIAAFIVIVFAGTTAFAQTALPGETLYGWKLGSEQVWRALSSDPVGVDLSIAERRAGELTRVAHDAGREDRARQGFHEVLTRLDGEKDSENGPRIDQALEAHQKQLGEAGIKDKQLDEMVRGKKH